MRDSKKEGRGVDTQGRLNKKARDGKIRSRIVSPEINCAIQVLSRRWYYQPAVRQRLEVGKTAIAEGLAKRINDS